MKSEPLLLDTHALFFWTKKTVIGREFCQQLDELSNHGKLYVSAVSFWELGLLNQKKRLRINRLSRWADDLVKSSGITVATPDHLQMIRSSELPNHHKDPFDRVLIVQAQDLGAKVVTRDRLFSSYGITTVWESS